jgi:predicted alpha/beta-hydrolase family hydrolase
MTGNDESIEFREGSVRGFLHRPAGAVKDALVLTHGAGGNCGMPLLVAVARAFVAAGVCVLRCDLPFRQRRPRGTPSPADAARDRAGLRDAVAAMRAIAPGRVFLGGQSYGGRQASMLAAEEPTVADALLLLSYPLHPPGKPEQLRTGHFPSLRTPALFVHGGRDPFASTDELRAALASIPARTALVELESAGHDLAGGKFDVAALVAAPFRELCRPPERTAILRAE